MPHKQLHLHVFWDARECEAYLKAWWTSFQDKYLHSKLIFFDKNHLFRIVCNGWECDDWTSEKCQIMSRVLVLKYSAWSSHAFIQYYHAVPSHYKTEMTHLSRGQKSRWCMMQTRCAGDQNDLKTKRETRSLCLSTVFDLNLL